MFGQCTFICKIPTLISFFFIQAKFDDLLFSYKTGPFCGDNLQIGPVFLSDNTYSIKDEAAYSVRVFAFVVPLLSVIPETF